MSIQSDRWIKEQSMMPQVWVAHTPDQTLEVVTGCNGPNDAMVLTRRLGREVRLATVQELYEELGYRKPMITPFEPGQVRERQNGWIEGFSDSEPKPPNMEKIISYGTSSYGYDVRCAPEFKVFTNIHSTVVDPKNFDDKSFVDFAGDSCIIPPNSFALARTVEYFRIPRDVLVICLGKSTYARCGIIVNVTPLEPEWEGHVTLEFSNTTPLPAKIYANEGCAQFLFFKGNQPCDISYLDRKGKYQGQTGVTLPKA